MSSSTEPALPWQAPKPATDAELQQHTLPCDVQVGRSVFRAGTPLLAIVAQHRELYARLYPKGELI